MTPQEAIKWIDGRMLEIVCEFEITTSEAGKKRLNKEYKALSALRQCADKEVEHKVLNKTLEYDGTYGHCPVCNRILRDCENPRRCPGCGKLIDWR